MKDKIIETGNCLECGGEYIKTYKERRFCGRSCASTHSAKIRTGKDKFTANCLQCGKEFKQKYNAKFCSSSCSATYNNQTRKCKPYRRVRSIKCLNCGEVKYTTNRVYCSRECLKGVARKSILKGECKNYRLMKKYLFETRGENCERCRLGSEWNGEKLTLQLDHIDGNSDNNKLENLRILCPNCHTQTHTYGSKNRSTSSRAKYLKKRRS